MRARRARLTRVVRLSVRQLAAHPLRTAIGISGLAAGVAAVTVMAAIGAGAEQRVLQRVRAMGTDLVVVMAPSAQAIAGRQRQVEMTTTLRVADAIAVAEGAAHAKAAAPGVSRAMTVRREGLNTIATLVGTTVMGVRIRNVVVETGRPFDEAEDRERRRVALIGPVVARNLFGTSDPVGHEIQVERVPFEVIGVLRARGPDVGGTDLDNEVVVPLETAMRRVLNVPFVHAIYAQATRSADVDALEHEVRTILDHRHRQRSAVVTPFTIRSQSIALRTERGATQALRQMTIGVAALALLVGGVGVLAIMLISVRERVREIGLRRACGARRSDIRLQFLLEASLLAVTGGAVGAALGLVAATSAALVGPWDLVIVWWAPALAVVSSIVLGLAAGVIPAHRAALLEPIDALRG
jgi:putative ABC transport system permease protein